MLWNCIALHCIHHLLCWKEVPALLTASYKTDSSQQISNAAYSHCLTTLLSCSGWENNHGFCLVEEETKLLPERWLKITWRYTICRLTGWFVPRFGRPQGLPHSSRGIGLRSIQGDGPEALWVFWSYNTSLTQLSSSVSKWMCEREWKEGLDEWQMVA